MTTLQPLIDVSLNSVHLNKGWGVSTDFNSVDTEAFTNSSNKLFISDGESVKAYTVEEILSNLPTLFSDTIVEKYLTAGVALLGYRVKNTLYLSGIDRDTGVVVSSPVNYESSTEFKRTLTGIEDDREYVTQTLDQNPLPSSDIDNSVTNLNNLLRSIRTHQVSSFAKRIKELTK